MIKKYDRRVGVAVSAVDVVMFAIINDKLNVGLIKTDKKELKDKLAFPGAIVLVDESLDECVLRVVDEKIGFKPNNIIQSYTFGDVDRDPFGRVISTSYIAFINPKKEKKMKSIFWEPVSRKIDLAYDHKEVLKKTLADLRVKISTTNLMRTLMGDEFTLSELQNNYEIVLNKDMDKRNFRKKIISLNMIVDLNKQEKGVKNRPASLYRFESKKIKEYNLI